MAVRLPSTLGFAALLAGVLGFCHRRMLASYAFMAALLVGISSNFFATNGRPYGLGLGFASGAIFCWQLAHAEKWRRLAIVGLAVCLMAMTASHYYFVFVIGPLVVGEIVRWRGTKKLDPPLYLALLMPLVIVAVHMPLILAFRRMSPTYWPSAISSWSRIPEFYFQFALVPIATLLAALVLVALSSSSQNPPQDYPSRTSILADYEWIAMWTLALLPIVVLVAARFTTHVFLLRYALPANIGIGILTVCVFQRVLPPRSIPVLLLGIVGAAAAFQQIWPSNSFTPLHPTHLRSDSALRQGEAIAQELRRLSLSPEPIVVDDQIAFLELSYYSEAPLKRRLVLAISRSLNLQYLRSDVEYLNYAALGRRANIGIADLDAFLTTNSRFILAVNPAEDYLIAYLQSAGYRLSPLDSRRVPILYEVQHR